jgi:pimeloyl-ACP methyl ester carboxylesterase
MLRSAEAEALLSENSYAWLKQAVLGADAAEADTAAYVEAWSQPGALTGGLNYYRASGVGPPPSDAAPSASALATLPLVVRVPTLVIWGEKDTALLTGSLNGLEELVPTLTIKRIPDVTHWIPRQKAAEVNTFMREFLQPAESGKPRKL